MYLVFAASTSGFGIKLGRASQAHPRSRSDNHPWIERSSDLDSGKRDRDQHGEVAQRESLRLLARIKPQQQDQWAAGVKLPHTQSRQSRGNDFTSSGDVAGQNQHPLGLLLPEKTRSVRCSKGNYSARKLGCLIYRLIKNGQGYKEPDLRTYELKYKDQILNSLRKRANIFGFDLVQVPKGSLKIHLQRQVSEKKMMVGKSNHAQPDAIAFLNPSNDLAVNS